MKFKDYFFNKLVPLRRLFLWGNVLLLILFLIVMAKDHKREWKPYQKEYKKREIAAAKAKLEKATTDADKVMAKASLQQAKNQKIEIRQIWNDDIGAVDRCITCHLGYDSLANASMTTPYEDHPFSAPADSVSFDIHKAHDVSQFGCVVCHGGQGLATDVEAAHGFVKHWEKPLKKDVILQSSCMQCHDNTSSLFIKGKNYTSEIIRAEQLFRDHGCIGCHQIGGEGGPISVDLKAETSVKPLSRIDFAYTGLDHKDWTLENWIKLHFTMDPSIIVPGDPKGEFSLEPIAPSGMPPYLMSEEDGNALTAYILGLNRSEIPTDFLVERPAKPKAIPSGQVAKGRWAYEEYGCAGCHGPQARGGVRNYNYFNDTMPNIRKSAATYTRAELREKLEHGVPIVAKHDPNGPNPPLYMPPWKDKIPADQMEALVTYLLSIKEYN